MRRASLALLAALAVTPAHADEVAAVLACDALGELARALVDLRFAGVAQSMVEEHIARADPDIRAPLTNDLVFRAYRLPDSSSPIVRARFRNSTGAAVVSECLPRLSAAIQEDAE